MRSILKVYNPPNSIIHGDLSVICYRLRRDRVINYDLWTHPTFERKFLLKSSITDVSFPVLKNWIGVISASSVLLAL